MRDLQSLQTFNRSRNEERRNNTFTDHQFFCGKASLLWKNHFRVVYDFSYFFARSITVVYNLYVMNSVITVFTIIVHLLLCCTAL